MSFYTRDALERRLCRWMLAMTPTQRLELLGECTTAILETHSEAYVYNLPEPYATRKAENEMRMLKNALEEQQRAGCVARPDPPCADHERN